MWPSTQVTYEEEEIQVKEVEKDVVTEISMPQVRTLYKYKGQGMGFDKGEVSCIGHRLICPHAHELFLSALHSCVKDQQRLVGGQVSNGLFINFGTIISSLECYVLLHS